MVLMDIATAISLFVVILFVFFGVTIFIFWLINRILSQKHMLYFTIAAMIVSILVFLYIENISTNKLTIIVCFVKLFSFINFITSANILVDHFKNNS